MNQGGEKSFSAGQRTRADLMSRTRVA